MGGTHLPALSILPLVCFFSFTLISLFIFYLYSDGPKALINNTCDGTWQSATHIHSLYTVVDTIQYPPPPHDPRSVTTNKHLHLPPPPQLWSQFSIWLIDFHKGAYHQLRARRVLLQIKDVPLRTRRVLLPLTVYSNSALLVLNGTSLICNNALLALK